MRIVFARDPMSIISFITPIYSVLFFLLHILLLRICNNFILITEVSFSVFFFHHLSVDASHPPSPLLIFPRYYQVVTTLNPMQH
jgi:hypothetical protein